MLAVAATMATSVPKAAGFNCKAHVAMSPIMMISAMNTNIFTTRVNRRMGYLRYLSN